MRPQALLFVYLVPLQISVCVYVGGLLLTRDGAREWQDSKLKRLTLPFGDGAAKEAGAHIANEVESFRHLYDKASESMVKYLEREHQRATDRELW